MVYVVRSNYIWPDAGGNERNRNAAGWLMKCSQAILYSRGRPLYDLALEQRCTTWKWCTTAQFIFYLSPPVRIESALVALCPHRAWVPQSTADAVEVLLFQHAVEAPHSTD